MLKVLLAMKVLTKRFPTLVAELLPAQALKGIVIGGLVAALNELFSIII